MIRTGHRRRRHRRRQIARRSLALLGLGALLLAPSAAGVPGDPTPPEITVATFGTLGENGWYRSNVSVIWTVTEPEGPPLSTSGCDAKTLTADTVGTTFTCSATSDGGTTSKSKPIKLDKTAPAVSGAADRPPDASGWYNRALTVSFSGTDGTAGIEACSSAGYSGPDNATASVSGTCRDKAGNVGTAAVSFKYDATAPTVSRVRTKPGNRVAHIAWKGSTDTQHVEVMRSPGMKGAPETVVYQGSAPSYRDTGLTAGRKYVYTVAVYDEAANRAVQSISFVARGALLDPAPGESVKSPPLLVWKRVKGAGYYNVQLMRGRRVLSAWPTRARFQLRRSWVFRGQRYRLRPGVYRWYVWPGLGRLSAGRFGHLLGGSSFVVTAPNG
jgi:hypothetical protein